MQRSIEKLKTMHARRHINLHNLIKVMYFTSSSLLHILVVQITGIYCEFKSVFCALTRSICHAINVSILPGNTNVHQVSMH
jgi:hypothetical protein